MIPSRFVIAEFHVAGHLGALAEAASMSVFDNRYLLQQLSWTMEERGIVPTISGELI